jgi:hypothetical protein
MLVGLLTPVIGLSGSAIVFRESLNTRHSPELYRRIETKNPPDFDAMLASVSDRLPSRTILAAGPIKGGVWIFQMRGERLPEYRTFPVRLKCFAHPGLRLQAYQLTCARATEDADLKQTVIVHVLKAVDEAQNLVLRHHGIFNRLGLWHCHYCESRPRIGLVGSGRDMRISRRLGRLGL